MPIKICFIGGARYSQPLNATSGKKFRALKSLGELFVIGYSQNIRPRRFTDHAHFYLLPKYPLSVLRYFEMFVVGPLLACWLVFRHGVQVLVAQSPYEGFAAALAKKIVGWLGHKVVLVVESHGDFEKSLFLQRRILLPRLYRFLMRFIANFALQDADLLRVVSDSTRRQLEPWILDKTIFQFTAWTDIESFLQVGAAQDGQSAQNILYAGVLIPLKGVHHLVNTFARIIQHFPQARLVIVGREENKVYAAQLKARVEQGGLNGRVSFIGEVPQAELAGRMQQACVFALPSYSEGLPRVVFEAMAVGLPVIASAVGGIPEVVQDGVRGFLVPPGDEEALTEKVCWVLEHPAEAQEIGHHARAFAERSFSTEAYVQGYMQILKAARALLKD